MTPKAYRENRRQFADYPGHKTRNPLYPALKLAGEAGEVAELIGKAIRKNDPEVAICDRMVRPDGTTAPVIVIDGSLLMDEYRDRLIDELGDVLWYVDELLSHAKATIEEAMDRNIAKLAERKQAGTIKEINRRV